MREASSCVMVAALVFVGGAANPSIVQKKQGLLGPVHPGAMRYFQEKGLVK